MPLDSLPSYGTMKRRHLENSDLFLALTAEDQKHELFFEQFDVLNLCEEKKIGKRKVTPVDQYK